MKKPYGIVFCNASNHDFECCDSGSGIRAIGNITPNFPDEELWLKHCQLHYHELGACKHQVELDKFPNLPIFFVANPPSMEIEIDKLDRIIDAKIKEYKDQSDAE